MNHITVNELSDLQIIIEEPIYISGKQSLLYKEIYHNMWTLTFSDTLAQEMQLQDLIQFVSNLLKKRTLQLLDINPKLTATFYLWFDKQAFQLRLNLISGDRTLALPFGCKLNILNSTEFILQNFITKAYQFATQGDIIKFFEPGEDQDDDENEIQKYVLDVYVEVINPIKN